MGTKADGDKCYDNALHNEPMFVLLARDVKAPELVRQWAKGRLIQIMGNAKPIDDIDLVAEALNQAAKMEAWREANDGKWHKDKPENLRVDQVGPPLPWKTR